MKKYLVVLVFLVMGCVYYNNVGPINYMMDAQDLIVTKAETNTGSGWVNSVMKGTSFPIKNGYQLALVHATIIEGTYKIRTPFGGYVIGMREVKNQKHFINDIEIELVGTLGDLALFKKPYETEFYYKLGKNPKIGDDILMLGYSMLNVKNIKTGIVSALKAGRYEKESEDFKHCFLHTIPSNPGDSGSPILAKSAMGYELVGILNALVPSAQGYGFGIKVSRINELLEKYEVYDG